MTLCDLALPTLPPVLCCNHRAREHFIKVTLGLPNVPIEQRFCSKQNTCDIICAICDKVPELAYIPDVLMHKIPGKFNVYAAPTAAATAAGSGGAEA